MVPTEFAITNQHAANVCVQVTGGQEDSSWKSTIPGPAFAEALAAALTKSRAFQGVVEAGADCRLEVAMVKLVQPDWGFDMTVTLQTQWRLYDVASGNKLIDDAVETSYTATFGAAFTGPARLRFANEGAGRENIKEGLRRVSSLTPLQAGAQR
jgi:hypothetical protein